MSEGALPSVELPLIHRSAWKDDSPQFVCTILHIPGPMPPIGAFPTSGRIEHETTCCGAA